VSGVRLRVGGWSGARDVRRRRNEIRLEELDQDVTVRIDFGEYARELLELERIQNAQ
jgi:hypothetical protein